MAELHLNRNWVEAALCADTDPDELFVQGAMQRAVRDRCLDCPVRLECLAEALECGATFGVWGGLTERERRALIRKYPKVEDWYVWIETSTEQVAVELRENGPVRVLALSRR